MENLSLILAQRLRQLRKGRGLSYAELSKELKAAYDIQISKESLTNYEVADANHTKAGKNEGMSIKYLRCLADYYQVSTDYLLGITTKEPSKDANIQAVCEFTGLSVNAIKAIKDCGGLIEVLNILLETPDMYNLISIINDIAICEGIKSYITSTKDSAFEKTFIPDNKVSGNVQEKIDAYKYRLSSSFVPTLESIIQKLLTDGGILAMVQKMAEHYEK